MLYYGIRAIYFRYRNSACTIPYGCWCTVCAGREERQVKHPTGTVTVVLSAKCKVLRELGPG